MSTRRYNIRSYITVHIITEMCTPWLSPNPAWLTKSALGKSGNMEKWALRSTPPRWRLQRSTLHRLTDTVTLEPSARTYTPHSGTPRWPRRALQSERVDALWIAILPLASSKYTQKDNTNRTHHTTQLCAKRTSLRSCLSSDSDKESTHLIGCPWSMSTWGASCGAQSRHIDEVTFEFHSVWWLPAVRCWQTNQASTTGEVIHSDGIFNVRALAMEK